MCPNGYSVVVNRRPITGTSATVNNFTFVALANHDIHKARVKSNLIFHKFRGVRFPCGKELETKIQNQSRGYQLEMERDHPTARSNLSNVAVGNSHATSFIRVEIQELTGFD